MPEMTPSPSTTSTPLTFGQKAVGLTFNPGHNPDVDGCKRSFANIIDNLDALRKHAGPGEKARLLSVAITEAQGAQMWAVKGITWADENLPNQAAPTQPPSDNSGPTGPSTGAITS
jgi:hypothetical protein